MLDGEDFRVRALNRTDAQGVVLLVQQFNFAREHQVLVRGDDFVKSGDFGFFVLGLGSTQEQENGQNQRGGSPNHAPNWPKPGFQSPKGLGIEMGRGKSLHGGFRSIKSKHETMLGEARQTVK